MKKQNSKNVERLINSDKLDEEVFSLIDYFGSRKLSRIETKLVLNTLLDCLNMTTISETIQNKQKQKD